MASHSSSSPAHQLGQRVRQAFVAEMAHALDTVADDVTARLTELMDAPATSAAESQSRRDAWIAFRTARPVWLDGVRAVWRKSLEAAPKKAAAAALDISALQLVGTDEVEVRILASRIVQVVLERANPELDDLRVRIKTLERSADFAEKDPLHPDALITALVQQWSQSGMPADAWSMVAEVVQQRLILCLKTAYGHANDTLIGMDILPVISLKDRVKAPVPRDTVSRPRKAPDLSPAGGQSVSGRTSGYGPDSGQGSGAGDLGTPNQRPAATMFGGRLGWGGASEPAPMTTPGPAISDYQDVAAQTAAQARGAADETRLMTAASPLQQAQTRANGVASQIRRIFVSRVGNDPGGASYQHRAPNPALAQAVVEQLPHASTMAVQMDGGGDTVSVEYSAAGVARLASNLRDRTAALKGKAETKSEKATIEIVALMFQAILAEERIPPGIRVWFARLQMPVLRLALEDPEFFSTTDHPARMLIDRMGSCVMGFDASGVQASAMETEVKRIVQVVEQYPETGKKVYQIVYAEFLKFLAKFLTEKEHTQKVVSVAQQVEQKETLAIQYTIEMRNMLKDMPVRDSVRDFLFKVWSEVLAVSALRNGAKHTDTLVLKKCATDLLWAASAKPGREERARVIQDLPHLLSRLRSGMTLLGLPTADQEKHIKAISDTLADAFLSKTHAIAREKIDAMAQRLSELEDFVSEDGLGDLPLDAESLEMMMGLEPGTIDVITNGGSKPTAAMLAWAQELHLGAWFALDHNGQVSQVQLVWRSDHKQLNLFAAPTGKTYLIQSGRLAAYLQAGLLVPQENEALTVRATRDAIAKIEANPERLLS